MYAIGVSDPDRALSLISQGTYGVKAYRQGNAILVSLSEHSGIKPEYREAVARELMKRGIPPEKAKEIAEHNQLQLIALLMLLAAGGIGLYYVYQLGGAVSAEIADVLQKIEPLIILGAGGLIALLVYWGFSEIHPHEAYRGVKEIARGTAKAIGKGIEVGQKVYSELGKVRVWPT